MKNNSTALLVIDIQEGFRVNRERWAKRSNPAFEENVTDLIDTFREVSLPVIWVQHTDSDPGFRATDPEFRPMDFLERREPEPLLVKTTRSSFASTDLQQQLDRMGVRKLVVCGIATEQCCETTARVAADLGYAVDFVTEATLTFGIGPLSTDAIVEQTEAALRESAARIVTVADVAEDLLAPAT